MVQATAGDNTSPTFLDTLLKDTPEDIKEKKQPLKQILEEAILDFSEMPYVVAAYFSPPTRDHRKGQVTLGMYISFAADPSHSYRDELLKLTRELIERTGTLGINLVHIAFVDYRRKRPKPPKTYVCVYSRRDFVNNP